ncbi:MAG: hypothetical protein DBW72_00465 [Flavobacteriales bacterium]|nr:MAG: hypothetical protein DBW72_00465 [Flavobacteriales bacterium]
MGLILFNLNQKGRFYIIKR